MSLSTSWFLHRAVRSFSTSAKTNINCHRASIARIGRLTYARMYPTIMVQSDGSTITIRYHEPRKIIKMPLDLTTLTEAERRKRLESRKPKIKVVIEDDVDDDFKLDSYEHLWKK
ncbi:large ribosomal subunit protein mL55 [Procambarus clarkii]|uniref:large ribosomal subunit protein mL55 n=1 Tax=Procambarus clarkii TaxID=6728 RepID=UPI001E67304B|nr:39S ribosomal protein L55, mitochondrial-like [Procambarus clarkii]